MSAPDRRLGEYRGPFAGPTFVALGALHGNEPAGLTATAAVLDRLARDRLPLRGSLVGVVGNRAALAQGRRFVARDLNRGWAPTDCRRIRDTTPAGPEDAEQRELLSLFDCLEADTTEPLCVLDLHSTSGPATPFSIVADVERCRGLALSLPIPTLLGLEELIEDAMFAYLVERGHGGLAVEGGQHDDPATVANLEAVIWLTLVAAGGLDATDVPQLGLHRDRLAAAATGRPRAVRITHRHGLVDDGDHFRMLPGFDNFTRVQRGATLALGPNGPVTAAHDGLVMLPRYQGQGRDGFFLAAQVSDRWLAMSADARRHGMEARLAHWPGLVWRPRAPNIAEYRGRRPPRPLLRALRLLGFHGMRPSPEGLRFFRRRP